MFSNTNEEISKSEIQIQNKLAARENYVGGLPYFVSDRYETGAAQDDDSKDFHLRTYLQRVFRHKWIVIFTTILLTAVVAVYLGQQPNVYKAWARVQVDAENSAVLIEGGKSVSPFDDRAYFNTQLELLESPGLIQRVVKRLNLEQNPDFTVGENKRPKSWQSKFTAAIDYLTQDEPSPPRTAEGGNADTAAKAVKAVQDGINVEPVLRSRQNIKDTRLIRITFYHPKPELSALVSNAVADELVASNLKTKMTANAKENDYLQNNIAELKRQIQRDEEKLLSFGRNYQLPSPDSSQNTVVERLVGLNRQLLEAENTRKLAEAEFQSAQKPNVANSLAESGDNQIASLDSKLNDLRRQRAQLLVEATEKYPDVIEVDRQIAVLEKQAQDRRQRATDLYLTNLENRYRQATLRENSIRQAFEQQRRQTLGQNEAAINYRIVQQSLETNKKLLDEMTEREKENEMLKAKAPNNIRVIDYAQTPNEPIDPKRLPMLGLAFLFSLSFGVGLAFLKDYFDDSVHSTDEVEKMLSLPALAVIPRVGSGFIGVRRRAALAPGSLHISQSDDAPAVADVKAELLFNADAQSPLAEAFRRLRTALLLSPSVGTVKKILVTSSQQSEGKTTTAVNIAASLAQTGAKVLLIDADLRNPQLHQIFNISNEYGLSDVFGRDIDKKELFGRMIKQSNLLYVLTAGSGALNSAECLGSARMHELLRTLEPVFDYIIIDSPPVVNFVDSTILATMTDGVLFVVQGNRSSRDMVRHSTKLLKTVGAKVIGVVLNKVGSPARRYYRSEGN